MKKLFYSLLLCFGLASGVSAQTILLDFNNANLSNTDPLNGAVYNNLTLTTASESFTNLENSAGGATTIGLTFTNNVGSIGLIVNGDPDSFFPSTATVDGYRDDASGAVVGTIWTFSFTGLDGSGATTYDLFHYAASNLAVSRTADFTLTVGTATTTFHDDIDTTDHGSVAFSGITPNASGVITYTIGDSSNNRAAVAQAISLVAIPEPSSFALIASALGLGLLMGRRRRHA